MNSRSIVLYAAAVLFSPDIALADNHAVTPRGQVDPIVLGSGCPCHRVPQLSGLSMRSDGRSFPPMRPIQTS